MIGKQIDTTKLREENAPYNSEWLFPVRMENSSNIVWEPNIVVALGRFKNTIEGGVWQRLISGGVIAAETPEEQKRLECWWAEGWQDTPQLAAKAPYSIPIVRTKIAALGETLDRVYPKIHIAMSDLNISRHCIGGICGGDIPCPFDGRLIALRQMAPNKTQRNKVDKKMWVVFAADNTIIGEYASMREIAEKLDLPLLDVKHGRDRYNNQLPRGMWMWYEPDGLVPITPKDQVLEKDWRVRYASRT